MDRREYYKQWREKNKEYVKQKDKERQQSESRQEWRKENSEKNREKLNEQMRAWRKNNPDRAKEIDARRNEKPERKERLKINHREYYKRKRETNPLFKTTENIRRMIQLAVKKNGFTKKSKTHQILGCSVEEFRQHLENQFEPWMTWDNYGKYNGQLNFGWDIDHIIPLATIETEEDVIRLNHYTNLKPLCSKFNRDIKRDNIL